MCLIHGLNDSLKITPMLTIKCHLSSHAGQVVSFQLGQCRVEGMYNLEQMNICLQMKTESACEIDGE